MWISFEWKHCHSYSGGPDFVMNLINCLDRVGCRDMRVCAFSQRGQARTCACYPLHSCLSYNNITGHQAMLIMQRLIEESSLPGTITVGERAFVTMGGLLHIYIYVYIHRLYTLCIRCVYSMYSAARKRQKKSKKNGAGQQLCWALDVSACPVSLLELQVSAIQLKLSLLWCRCRRMRSCSSQMRILCLQERQGSSINTSQRTTTTHSAG